MKREATKQLKYLLQHRALVAGLVIVILMFAGIMVVQAHPDQPGTATEQDDAAKPVTTQQITQHQRQLKADLHTYLKKVTADGTTSVSFYNLGAVPGSAADKATLTDKFYAQGDLATSANAHTPVVAASTYKLFIAAYVFQQSHLGTFAWTPTNQDGFHRMIVNSANDFADDLLDERGLQGINALLTQEGYYSPAFIEGQSAETTATSLMMVLRDLATQSGPFKHAKDQQKLLSLMKTQVYRDGIPAGATAATKGATVADKVGFMADTNNDAGIVTLPNGERYILVIMTHGHQQSGFSGFPRMAKITTHIQKMVYAPSVVKGLKN